MSWDLTQANSSIQQHLKTLYESVPSNQGNQKHLMEEFCPTTFRNTLFRHQSVQYIEQALRYFRTKTITFLEYSQPSDMRTMSWRLKLKVISIIVQSLYKCIKIIQALAIVKHQYGSINQPQQKEAPLIMLVTMFQFSKSQINLHSE